MQKRLSRKPRLMASTPSPVRADCAGGVEILLFDTADMVDLQATRRTGCNSTCPARPTPTQASTRVRILDAADPLEPLRRGVEGLGWCPASSPFSGKERYRRSAPADLPGGRTERSSFSRSRRWTPGR